MAKRTGGKNREEKLKRKLDKAQTELRRVQEKRVLAMTRGEQKVEQARQQAADRLARATERVERRTAVVARLEAQLVEPPSPDAAAETLDQVTEPTAQPEEAPAPRPRSRKRKPPSSD